MRVFGIDPGSQCTGYGVIELTSGKLKSISWGALRSPAKLDFPGRLKLIYDGLTDLIQQYDPDEVAVEDLFFAVNAKSTLKLGQTRGVALLSAVKLGKPISEYSPLEVKQSVVGYGRADKSQVRSMVKVLLSLEENPEPHDASDALAIAICHAHSAGLKSRLASHKGSGARS